MDSIPEAQDNEAEDEIVNKFKMEAEDEIVNKFKMED